MLAGSHAGGGWMGSVLYHPQPQEFYNEIHAYSILKLRGSNFSFRQGHSALRE